MKSILLFFTFVLIHSFVFAQNIAVEITYKKDQEGFAFSAKNNRSVQHEVTLTIEATNLKGYKKPITKLIPANSTVNITKLYFIPEKKGSFKYNYTYQPKLTKNEEIENEKKLMDKITKDVGDTNEGIVVFSKDGCPRCHFTTNYLLENDVEFKFINISEEKNLNKIMWQLLRKDNPTVTPKSVIMPVILVDGKLSYNIEDLKKTISELSQ